MTRASADHVAAPMHALVSRRMLLAFNQRSLIKTHHIQPFLVNDFIPLYRRSI